MKKFALLLVPLAALGIGLFFWLSGDPYEELAKQQLSLIREAVDAIAAFEETGNDEEALARMASLKKEFSNWSANQNRLAEAGEKAPGEVLVEIEQKRGELANAMIQLEVSDHQKAPEVLAALENLVNQP